MSYRGENRPRPRGGEKKKKKFQAGKRSKEHQVPKGEIGGEEKGTLTPKKQFLGKERLVKSLDASRKTQGKIKKMNKRKKKPPDTPEETRGSPG